MAYEKQTFVDRVFDENGKVLIEGTTLKAQHLKHIENGIEAATNTADAASASISGLKDDIKEVREQAEEAGAYKLAEGTNNLEAGKYYVFGEVSELAVTLAEGDVTKANEYCFEFVPTADFAGLTVTPEPAWANTPNFAEGKTCQVSILRGVAVMICA